MIVSASRRTDIPAFFSDWLMNRLRAGYCLVKNPYNPARVSRVNLAPSSAEALVLWTRHPGPLLEHLEEILGMGHRLLVLFTITGLPRVFEPSRPPALAATDLFVDLARRLPPGAAAWRYDPILVHAGLDADWHARNFARLASRIQGSATRCTTSFAVPYAKTARRLPGLATPRTPHKAELLGRLRPIAADHGLDLATCCDPVPGIPARPCIDAAWLKEVWGVPLASGRDPGQREHCLCAPSRDIGAYETCGFGCRYCYATADFDRARDNRARHDPASPLILGQEPDTGQAGLWD